VQTQVRAASRRIDDDFFVFPLHDRVTPTTSRCASIIVAGETILPLPLFPLQLLALLDASAEDVFLPWPSTLGRSRSPDHARGSSSLNQHWIVVHSALEEDPAPYAFKIQSLSVVFPLPCYETRPGRSIVLEQQHPLL